MSMVLVAVLTALAAGTASSTPQLQDPANPSRHVLKNATLMNHSVVVDGTGKIVPWIVSGDPFAALLELAWKWWVPFPWGN